MNLLDIVHRIPVPSPWSEGDKIPWNEPGFSARMLKEHLSQAHDAASRRAEIIDRHVAWIHNAVLSDRPTRILDLGCGPGLYLQRLAKLGHACVGVDFSPASIAYARQTAVNEEIRIDYREGDLRQVEFGEGFGLVMLIFGEFNTFRAVDAKLILGKAHRALAANGRLLLEPHTFDGVRATGQRPATWYSSSSGLFSESPHIVLKESFWDAEQQASTERYHVIDALTGAVERSAASMQAYTDAEYSALLQECDFQNIEFYPSLTGSDEDSQPDLCVVLCKKE